MLPSFRIPFPAHPGHRAKVRGIISWVFLGGVVILGRGNDAPAATPATSAPPPSVTSTNASPLVARGQGLEIRATELEGRMRRALTEITNTGRGLSATQAQAMRARLLDQMIFTRVAAGRATPGDRTRAQFESRSFVDGLQRDLGSPAALIEKLTSLGITEADFRAEKLEEALALAVTERELRGSIHLPEADVRKYYDENPARWQQPEQVRVAHLLLATQTEKGEPLPGAVAVEKKERLRKLRVEVQKGGDFAALIKTHGEDKASQGTAGEYTFARGQMDPVFEAASFALKPGELSPVVTTPYGFHLIMCRARIPATNTPLAAVEAEIRHLLIQREKEFRMPEYATRIRREAKVEVFALP